MIRDKALTLEALRVLDEIERRGSFAAAAQALGRVPSALSYTIQKLEEELDVALFDRSGHRTKFTSTGRMLMEQGRYLLDAVEKLTHDTITLAHGWEPSVSIVCDGVVSVPLLFPLVDKLALKSRTQLSITTEILSGTWERLEQGVADIVIAPALHFHASSEVNYKNIYRCTMVYVAAPSHPIHKEKSPLSTVSRIKYRGIAVADTATVRPRLTVQLLDNQPRLSVSSMEDKRQAILAGLGIGTLPLCLVQDDLNRGVLTEISGNKGRSSMDIIMVWRRESMGEAKSWLLREIPKLFIPQKNTF